MQDRSRERRRNSPGDSLNGITAGTYDLGGEGIERMSAMWPGEQGRSEVLREVRRFAGGAGPDGGTAATGSTRDHAAGTARSAATSRAAHALRTAARHLCATAIHHAASRTLSCGLRPGAGLCPEDQGRSVLDRFSCRAGSGCAHTRQHLDVMGQRTGRFHVPVRMGLVRHRKGGGWRARRSGECVLRLL